MSNCGHTRLYARDMFNQPQELGTCLYCTRDALAAETAALKARLAEAERFIEELNDESAEDWRTRKYVVIQMTEETWDKLRSWKPSDSTASQPPPVITFPEDMSTAERIGDPRIDGQPTVAPCTCPSGGAWADLNQAHLPECPRGNTDNERA